MEVWLILGAAALLTLLVRWRPALRGWLLSAAGGLAVLLSVGAAGAGWARR